MGATHAIFSTSLDRELDNLRAALVWAARGDNVQAELRLASGLWRYWRVRSYFSEGGDWLEKALSRSEGASKGVRARAMLGAGSLAKYQADYEGGGAVGAESGVTSGAP